MPDTITQKLGEITVAGFKGLVEAPWLFKRKSTYYLAFADNDTEPKAADISGAVWRWTSFYGTTRRLHRQSARLSQRSDSCRGLR